MHSASECRRKNSRLLEALNAVRSGRFATVVIVPSSVTGFPQVEDTLLKVPSVLPRVCISRPRAASLSVYTYTSDTRFRQGKAGRLGACTQVGAGIGASAAPQTLAAADRLEVV